MKVVITIPCFNEEKTIGKVIDEINKVMGILSYDYQIIVVNDGSYDQTGKIAHKHGAIVINNKRNLGLAETFKIEMNECIKLGAKIIVHTDADGQYPAKYIPELIKGIENGYDLVLGSRFKRGAYSGSFVKRMGNIIFALVFSKILNAKITDTTTGFRALTSEVANLPLINDFTYTQEQLIRAAKRKLNVGEIFIKTRKTRKSKLFSSPIHYAIKAWINIFRIYRDFAPIKFFGFFGGILFSIGLILGIWIVYTIILTGSVGGIPRVILSALALISGLQIMLFGFLADMLRK
jgi:glycosyltransferase involved in cell wall biosynthesis